MHRRRRSRQRKQVVIGAAAIRFIEGIVLSQSLGCHAKLFGAEQTPIAKRLTQHATSLPTSSINVERAAEQGRASDFPEAAHHLHILHQRYLRKATESIENGPAEKQSLIAKRQHPQACSSGIAPLEQTVPPRIRYDPLIETAAQTMRSRQSVANLRDSVRRQPGVGVQEK